MVLANPKEETNSTQATKHLAQPSTNKSYPAVVVAVAHSTTYLWL